MSRPRSILLALRKTLGKTLRPIYLVDSDRTIQYCNDACLAWTGLSAETLIGRRCDYHWEIGDATAERAVAALAVPPEVYSGRQLRRLLNLGGSEGAMRQRWATFVPLATEDQQAAVLVILDATDCRQGEATHDHDTEPDESARLHLQLAQMRRRLGPLYELHQIAGISPGIQRVRDQIRAAAASGSRTVIVGPPGSGREHMARTIYYLHAPAATGALVPLSCNLLDAELLQTTITSFIRTRPEIEVTGPAALLLLDVDQLSADAQRALMAVLNIVELKAYTLATASNSLFALVEQGEFRPDLANYLSTMVIELPPLHARTADIPLLAQKLLEATNADSVRQLSGFSQEALDLMTAYGWPGNVDELAREVRRVHLQASGPLVEAADLSSQIRDSLKAAAHPRRDAEPIDLDQYLSDIEKELMQRALKEAKGNRAQAARLLGIPRARLLRRLEQLGLE
jgi:transcriptional regulator with PAS, ATPase and Fis domain